MRAPPLLVFLVAVAARNATLPGAADGNDPSWQNSRPRRGDASLRKDPGWSTRHHPHPRHHPDPGGSRGHLGRDRRSARPMKQRPAPRRTRSPVPSADRRVPRFALRAGLAVQHRGDLRSPGRPDGSDRHAARADRDLPERSRVGRGSPLHRRPAGGQAAVGRRGRAWTRSRPNLLVRAQPDACGPLEAPRGRRGYMLLELTSDTPKQTCARRCASPTWRPRAPRTSDRYYIAMAPLLPWELGAPGGSTGIRSRCELPR
jgi:hypothetical protein